MKTLLDNDLYKFTMMHAVWRKYPQAQVKYQFKNRNMNNTFGDEAIELIRQTVIAAGNLRLSEAELAYLRGLDLFDEAFLTYLEDFQLKPKQVDITADEGRLEIWIEGAWLETILWEVPLMAIISEIYFQIEDTHWVGDLDTYFLKALEKGRRLSDAGCQFSDFGTRRRRSYATQDQVVKAFAQEEVTGCIGTSNVHFAMKYGLHAIGTMAHEWIMAHAGMGEVVDANGRALAAWQEVYGEKLLIALTDTYTTNLFLDNFNGELAKEYEGVRHDSECPLVFADKVIGFYEEAGIDPTAKKAIFSDSLNVDRAIEIQNHINGRIQPYYGIGTHFTNDFGVSKALNIVIKLYEINDVPVAKISDNPAKANGKAEAVERALEEIETVAA